MRMLTDQERAHLYRAEGHDDGEGGRMLFRTFGMQASTTYRPSPYLGTRAAATAVRAEPLIVAGYAVRWRQIATLYDGTTESFGDAKAIVNDPLKPRLVLGHGGPVISEDVQTRSDPVGLWCTWRVDPLLTDPALVEWLATEERGLSLGWVNLAPPILHRSYGGRVHRNPSSVWIGHVAVLPPGQQPAYPGAHTMLPVAS
jgi:hypothetical protein